MRDIKRWVPKPITVTVRLDADTFRVLETTSRTLKTRRSDIIRTSIWTTILLYDNRLTLGKALKNEYLHNIPDEVKNVPVSQLLKKISEIAKELGYM